MSVDNESHNSSNQELYFPPIVNLPLMTTGSAEEDEDCIYKRKAKIYRFDFTDEPPEWKERGTGYLKILVNKISGRYRLLMRRDKTLKVCANHMITSGMELRRNCNNARAFVWQTVADFADELQKPESLGIRFATVNDANLFKKVFNEGIAHSITTKREKHHSSPTNGSDTDSKNGHEEENSDLTESLDKLHLQTNPTTNDSASSDPKDKVAAAAGSGDTS